MPTRSPLRIAIDSGGTFTDCVWLQPQPAQNRRRPGAPLQPQPAQNRRRPGTPLEDATLRILKVFSTPTDPAQAIAEAVKKIASESQDIIVLHGTTVGTNTLLQRKGA
ncbi:MAG TPA: hydantoinase/oxoprolinase N-terminal domain-containing protein, partial [Candidatus Angelobacter sp.]|nr:hydantoinase/oxoprolinase N-terminal domain-containing protein [Candidatus Angelobacter sp.]